MSGCARRAPEPSCGGAGHAPCGVTRGARGAGAGPPLRGVVLAEPGAQTPPPGAPPASPASPGAAGAPPSGGPVPSTERPASPTSRRASAPPGAPAPAASWTPAPATRGPRPARAGTTPAPRASSGPQTAPPALPAPWPAPRARPAADRPPRAPAPAWGTPAAPSHPPALPQQGHTSVTAAVYRPTGDAALAPRRHRFRKQALVPGGADPTKACRSRHGTSSCLPCPGSGMPALSARAGGRSRQNPRLHPRRDPRRRQARSSGARPSSCRRPVARQRTPVSCT